MADVSDPGVDSCNSAVSSACLNLKGESYRNLPSEPSARIPSLTDRLDLSQFKVLPTHEQSIAISQQMWIQGLGVQVR